LAEIQRIAAKLGDRVPTLTAIPPKTKRETEAIINLYGRFA
jgi:hypothetical protein